MAKVGGSKVAFNGKAQVLLLLPRTYLDNTSVCTAIGDLPEAVPGVIRLTVSRASMVDGERRRLQLGFEDERGAQVNAAVFGDFHRWQDIKSGDVILVRAKRGSYGGYPELRGPVAGTSRPSRG